MKGKGVFMGFGLVTIAFMVILAGCTEDNEEEGEDVTINITGADMTLSSIFSDHDSITIETGSNSYEGVSLSILVTESGQASPETHQYRITASDGWSQEVTWGDMQVGILVEEDTMTAFPGLPGKYRIRDVATIEAVDDVKTIEVIDHIYTWKQPFHIIDDPVEMIDEDNNTVTGVYLSSVVNLTGLSNPETQQFNLVGEDGYNKTVTWEDMTKGILDEENEKCFFPHLSKEYHISDIARIEVM